MFDVPYINICGGREPSSLINYKNGISLSSCGKLDCCKDGGCHINKFEGKNCCKYKLFVENDSFVTSKCMHLITPENVEKKLREIF